MNCYVHRHAAARLVEYVGASQRDLKRARRIIKDVADGARFDEHRDGSLRAETTISGKPFMLVVRRDLVSGDGRPVLVTLIRR